MDRSTLKLRSITPQSAMTPKSQLTATGTSSRIITEELTTNHTSFHESNSMVIVGESASHLASEFVYSVHYSGNPDQAELAKNSIALKLIRSQREKSSGLVTLVFDFIFCPSKSFM
jgi:hypothetical protein